MDSIKDFFAALKELAPALVLGWIEYLGTKIKREEIERQEVEHDLAALKAKDASEKKFAGQSDSDVLDTVLGGQKPK